MQLDRAQSKTLYNTDYIQWVEATLQQLRSRDYDRVDWDNLLDEIEEIGKRDRRSIDSHLVVVLVHLLKWQLQSDCRTGSWASSITEHRRRILRLLKDSPSLKPYIETILEECYQSARKQAHQETGLLLELFPAVCPYPVEDILNNNFLSEIDLANCSLNEF